MKIGIIKPGLKDYCLDKLDNSNYGGLSEIRGVYDILSKYHDVEIMSTNLSTYYDIIVIFNGACKDKEILKNIRKRSSKKVQIITDLNLVYTQKEIGKNKHLTQATEDINYFPFEMLCLRYLTPQLNHSRKYKFGYAGGTREGKRDEYYRKYLSDSNIGINENVDWIHTSSKLFGNSCYQGENPVVKPKIPFKDLQEKYGDTEFSLVIADKKYNRRGFLTQRPWELMMAGCIPLVDKQYDKNHHIFSKHSVFRIHSFNKLNKKLNMHFTKINYYRELIKSKLIFGIKEVYSKKYEDCLNKLVTE